MEWRKAGRTERGGEIMCDDTHVFHVLYECEKKNKENGSQ